LKLRLKRLLKRWYILPRRFRRQKSKPNFVTLTGGVDQFSVLKGVDPELDAEVVRVVKILPKFKPGKQGGKPVPVWYTIPINFQLK
jgi:TonB family protein